MEKFNDIIFSIGGNLNNSAEKFDKLWKLIKSKIGIIKKKSSFYESEALGFVSENSFINSAICVESALSPNEILLMTQNIERELGRTKKSIGCQYSDRSMDIDIITYEDKVIQSDTLTIPHPRMHERKFVLIPLCEISPEWKHPILKKKALELLKECPDKSKLVKIVDFY